MNCRPNCGACCIYPSISSPIPGMPDGKQAGVRCIQLADDMRCKIFNSPKRPKVCSGFKAEKIICGNHAQEAKEIITSLEQASGK